MLLEQKFLYEKKNPIPKMAKKEKKRKLNSFLVLAISFIMVSSIIGFLYSGRNNQFKYNGINFKRDSNSNEWYFVINNKRFVFNYFPSEVELINISPDIMGRIKDTPEIDVTSDLNDSFEEEIALAKYNMALTLGNLNVYLRNGFTTNNSFGLPIITCDNASLYVPVIYFKSSNRTRIYLMNDCIIADAKEPYDVLRIKDRILYSLLGVMG